MTVDDLIDGLINVEAGYSNNPNDAGGETIWGITVAVARANGYGGPMIQMPRSEAARIYKLRYVYDPGFDKVFGMAGDLGRELVDIGVNMGVAASSMMLQRALNAFNRQGKDYADVPVTGTVGPLTMKALSGFLTTRGGQGAAVITEAVRCLRGERYIAICEGRPANEEFVFGWFVNRVMGT
jgi:lysozyme family protein